MSATERQNPEHDNSEIAARMQEYAAMRDAYRKQPDSGAEADDWSSCEEFDI